MSDDTERPWTAKGLSIDQRAEEFAHHMWLNRMSNVFDLADPAKRYAEIKGECQEAIEAALAGAAPKWVPVAERLPGAGKCLAIGKHWGCSAIAQYIDGEWWSYGYRSRTVTHWMPMPPAPPEPGEEVK